MKWFKNMKIRLQMLVSFMVVIALVMTLVVLAVRQIVDVGVRYHTVVEHPVALRIALLEFQAEFRDLRRIGATIAVRASMGEQEYESLFREAASSYYLAIACLDRAKNIVNTNPELTQAEKDARMANNDILRGRFKQYRDEVTASIANAARNPEELQKFLVSADDVAQAAREKLMEMLGAATATANSQIQRAEDRANRSITLLIAISIATALIAVAISLYIANHIGSPLVPLAKFMNDAASAGDFTFSPEDAAMLEKFSRNRDEPGQVIAAALAFVGRVLDVGKALKAVAGGDLSSGIPLLSDRDSMGIAFKKMVDNLNTVCGGISESSVQVASGANQVTAAAQALSAGTTEQASSIEEFSVTIADMDERTKENARMAGRAADLAHSIRDSAEQGSQQMNGMMAAVGDISEANQSIRKIIKVIDSIAFQTNILAVNAAVEAAHAGKYGKGFSVVATEVRNLAAKSATAAKETERLIADSIEKTELGVSIASETYARLSAIVSGINDNSRLVSEIAQSSKEQSVSISQINDGITQVAKVVYQNSSTAEETAAAAVEMTGQSDKLQELVSRFKLRDKSVRYLPEVKSK